MATFDTLIDDLATRYGLGANARSLIKEVLTMISGSSGGLAGFLGMFKEAGLSSEVTSWLGRPDAGPIAAGQVERALGATVLSADWGPPRLGARRPCDRARIRRAEDRWPFDAGRSRSRRCPRGGHGFSLATDGTGAGARAGRLSGERARTERARRRALAVARARRAGRRRLPGLFLVEPDAVRFACRKGAGTWGARAPGRRAGATPAACSFGGGATARSAAASDACAGVAPCSRAFDGRASFASAASCAARRTGFGPDGRTGACDLGSRGRRNG